MRKLIAVALAVVTLTSGVPASVMAQSAVNMRGTISGEAVDAGGRAVPGHRVELVQSGLVVQTTVTGSNGRFTFANVAAGDYIVRVLLNGRPAGVRVALAEGAAAAHALIVTPSALAPSAGGGGGVLIPWLDEILAALVAIGSVAITTVLVKDGS